MNALAREDFQKLDNENSLACFRDEFFLPQLLAYKKDMEKRLVLPHLIKLGNSNYAINRVLDTSN